MGRKYNLRYKKGKFNNNSHWHPYRNIKGLSKSQIADYSKTSKYLTEDRKLWMSDPRKYDLVGVDTRREGERIGAFNYKYRSKKKLGRKFGRENKHYRRYFYAKRRRR